MPRIEIRTPRYQDYLAPDPWYKSIGRAGEALQSGLERAQAQRAANKRAQAQAAEQERRFAIEEERAKASLLKETNALAEKQAKSAEREADREAVVQGLTEIGAKQTGRAREEQVRNALASPGGLLGPFGLAQSLARGAPNTMEVEARAAGRMELAKRMSPGAGRMFLEREAKIEKQQVLAQGYEAEFKALENALMDGAFDDPFLTPSKPGQVAAPSEQAQAKAKQYAQALQDELAAGRPPGEVHKRLAEEYDINAKLSARKKAWEKADTRADAMLEQMREMAVNVDTGVNPITGKSDRDELSEWLAIAAAEWERVSKVSFRRANDPDASLAELRKFLYRSQETTDQEAFLAGMERTPPLGITQEQVVGAATAGESQENAPGRAGLAPPQASQARSGAKRTDTGARPSDAEVKAGAPAREAERAKRGLQQTRKGSEPTKDLTPAKEKSLRGLVQERAKKTLAAGDEGERVQAAAEIIKAIRTELGIDPNSPGAKAAIRDELNRIWTAVRGG